MSVLYESKYYRIYGWKNGTPTPYESKYGGIRQRVYKTTDRFRSVEKGKLLYQMPENIYVENRKYDLGWIYSGIFIMIVVLFPIFLILALGRELFEVLWVTTIVGLTSLGLFLLFYFEQWRISRLNMFEIYENGYIPCAKPLIYTLRKKEYFIPFDKIKKIEYRLWGEGCILSLKNDKREWVTMGWEDIDGYIEFSKIMKRYFPNAKYPNFDVVKERFNAWQDKLNKKITTKEYKIIIHKMLETNKDFDTVWWRK